MAISAPATCPAAASTSATPNAQQAGAFQMKIATIVPEGTLVKEGDVVAELDRSTLASKMQETALNVQKSEALYEQAMLDSTLISSLGLLALCLSRRIDAV